MSLEIPSDPIEAEETYVHKIYNEIAAHFSQTRYKPWPIVEKFLLQQKVGSVGLDIGCGNGKYMGVNKNVLIIGSDRSDGLVRIASERGHEVMVADALNLPHQRYSFDFAISIAVIHHFSTPERRIEAVKSILSMLNENGQALVYVWALEQENSRRGWKKGMNPDVFVPWVLQKNQKKKKDSIDTDNEEKSQAEPEVKQRYYHLYEENELERDAAAAGGTVVQHGYERDNWWAIIKRA